MLIEFRSADRLLGVKALGIYGKMLEAAKGACDKVYAPTLYLDSEQAQSGSASEWLYEKLDEMGVGEVREVEMPSDLALSLRNAASVYLAQLTKLAEKQSDLLVPLEETNEVTSQVMSLADRLRGQIEMSGVVSGGVTITRDSAARGLEAIDRATRFPDATASFNGGPETTLEDAARQAGESIARQITAKRKRGAAPRETSEG